MFNIQVIHKINQKHNEFDHVSKQPYSKNKKVKARDVLVQFTLENELCKVCFGNISKTVHENAIKMPNA